MPTYEYRCKACGHELEAFQKITEDALRTCPQCQKDELERLISGGNFVLKGSGWYKDLYSPNPSQPRKDNDRADRAQKAIDADKKKSEKKADAA